MIYQTILSNEGILLELTCPRSKTCFYGTIVIVIIIIVYSLFECLMSNIKAMWFLLCLTPLFIFTYYIK